MMDGTEATAADTNLPGGRYEPLIANDSFQASRNGFSVFEITIWNNNGNQCDLVMVIRNVSPDGRQQVLTGPK